MLDKIKSILFYDTQDSDEEDQMFNFYSEEYLIKFNDRTYIGFFSTEDIEDYSLYERKDVTISEIVEKYKIYFIGTDAQQEINDIELKDITSLKKLSEIISISEEINNDTDQPERAIANYLIRESQETKFTQKEFYQMVIDSAEHELNLINNSEETLTIL